MFTRWQQSGKRRRHVHGPRKRRKALDGQGDVEAEIARDAQDKSAVPGARCVTGKPSRAHLLPAWESTSGHGLSARDPRGLRRARCCHDRPRLPLDEGPTLDRLGAASRPASRGLDRRSAYTGPDRRFLGGFDTCRRRRHPRRARSCHSRLRAAPLVEGRGIRRVRRRRRVRRVPPDDGLRPPAATRRRSPGEPAGERELPIRATSRPRSPSTVRLRSSSARVSRAPRRGSSSGSLHWRFRCSSRHRACCVECIIRPTWPRA